MYVRMIAEHAYQTVYNAWTVPAWPDRIVFVEDKHNQARLIPDHADWRELSEDSWLTLRLVMHLFDTATLEFFLPRICVKCLDGFRKFDHHGDRLNRPEVELAYELLSWLEGLLDHGESTFWALSDQARYSVIATLVVKGMVAARVFWPKHSDDEAELVALLGRLSARDPALLGNSLQFALLGFCPRSIDQLFDLEMYDDPWSGPPRW